MSEALIAGAGMTRFEKSRRACASWPASAPEETGCAEVHDASAPAEPMVYEQVGFAAPGEGPALLESGRTRLDGEVPVNTSGGLLSPRATRSAPPTSPRSASQVRD